MPTSCKSQHVRTVRFPLYCLACLIALSGCATQKNFKAALQEPAAASTRAAAVVASAATDVLRANALGLVDAAPANPVELVCTTQTGLRTTALNLGQFGEALEAVDEVAAAPDDVSFAGYIAQIRKNKQAIKDAGDAPNIEQQLAEKKRVADYNRCKALLMADWAASPRLSADSAMQLHGINAAVGTVLAFRDLALALLQYGEAAQREQAIRATIKALVPQLRKAVDTLGAPIDPVTFGSRVGYPDSAPALARDMNATNLGASVTIQRWMTAVQIKADWDNLAACRNGRARPDCVGNADTRATAADFAAQVANYRSLAKINDQAILKALAKAVNDAETAIARNATLAEMLDALATVGDAVTDIAGKVDAARAAHD